MGFDKMLHMYDQTIRKKNLEFWTKCGFEINKEIKGNEVEKLMGFDTMLGFGICMYEQTMRKKNLDFWTKCGFEINKEIKGNEAKK